MLSHIASLIAISKKVNFNTAHIKDAIEGNKGSRVFAGDVSSGLSQMTKLNRGDGSVVFTKAEVLRVISMDGATIRS